MAVNFHPLIIKCLPLYCLFLIISISQIFLVSLFFKFKFTCFGRNNCEDTYFILIFILLQEIRRDFIQNEVVNWELGMHIYGYLLEVSNDK